MGKQTFYILAHKYLGLNFSHSTSQFKEQCATSIIQTSFLAGIRECLTREAAREEINSPTKRSKIYLMDVTFQYIPFRVIMSQCLACHSIHFIQ